MKIWDAIPQTHEFPNCNTQEVHSYQQNREVTLWRPLTQVLLVTVVVTITNILCSQKKLVTVVAWLTQN